MKTIEYKHVDKSTWGEGPWTSEPDKLQWQDQATGLPCLIVRNHSGALCGYVGVPEAHPWHGLHYDNTAVDVEVHGGLTFSDRCQPKATEHGGICHVVEKGEPDNVWWLGFDCAHSGDESPAYSRRYPIDGEVYRDLAYVKAEVASLALQVQKAA